MPGPLLARALMRPRPDTWPRERLIRLIYELLDAHDDTARLAGEATVHPAWEPHLVYLRDLQRLGREVLAAAEAGVEDEGPTRYYYS